MQFWQAAASAASSKFVGENFGADEELANGGGESEGHPLTFLP